MGKGLDAQAGHWRTRAGRADGGWDGLGRLDGGWADLDLLV